MKWNFKWGKNDKQEMTPELTERGVNVYQHENKIKGAEHLGEIKCVECGKWFTPEHHAQRVCSDECRIKRIKRRKSEWMKHAYEARKQVEAVNETNEGKETTMAETKEVEPIMRGGKTWTPPIKTCPACGKQFVAASNRQVYCSDECQRNAYAGKQAVKTTPSGFKYVSTAPTRPIKCEICGKSFVPRTKRGKYCSDECRKEAARRISREWDAAHRSSEVGVKLKRVTVADTAPQYESKTNIHLEVATVVRKLVEAGVDDEIVAKYLQTYYGSK